MEQEFVVQPGADLRHIRISYRGIDGVETAEDGSLLVRTAFGTLRETKPRIYQQIAGKKRTVDGRFKLLSKTSYSFDIGPHSEGFALIVDPTLLYSTLLGGTAGSNAYVSFGNQLPTGIAVDSSGNAYVAGNTIATDFPTTTGAFQPSPASGTFITKLNTTGSALIYSTYLGYSASITGIAVDSSGQAYVTGETSATYYSYTTGHYFPTTANAYWPRDAQHQCASGDFYITELNATGNGLVYSSCFNISGGAANGSTYGFYPRAITVDSNGRAYIAGGAADVVPTTANAYQPFFPGGSSAYLAIFDTTASGSASLVYATYLGPTNGNANALAYGVAVDSFGKVYLTGSAYDGFPITPGAFQTTHSSAITDVFVAKIDPSVSGQAALVYSTYLGGGPSCSGGCGGSGGSAVAVDGSGAAYVTGVTESPYFPTTPGAFQTTCRGFPGYVFVSKLSTSGSQLVYSTCLAGNTFANGNSAGGIAVDSLGNAYIAGGFRAQTLSTFPVTPNAFQNSFTKLSGDYSEAFLTELNANGSGLIYSSYLGGNGDDQINAVAIDQTGDAYVAGFTTSSNFPVTPTAFQTTLRLGGGYVYPQSAFVTKFPLGSAQALSISSLQPTSGGNAGSVTINIQGGGFHNGASVALVGGSTITGSSPFVGTEGRTITVVFDLNAASIGSYAIVVTNPDGTSVTASQPFTVQKGGAPNLQISLTGLAVTHGANGNSVVDVVVSNTGSVDSSDILVLEPIPSPFSLTSISPSGVAGIAALTTASEAMWSGFLPPGASQVFTLTAGSTSILTSAGAGPSLSSVRSAASSPSAALNLTRNACVMQDFQRQAFAFCVQQGVCALCSPPNPLCKQADALLEQIACNQCGAAAANCSDGTSSCPVDLQKCIGDLALFTKSTGNGGSILDGCKKGICTQATIPEVHSIDPNNLVGPSGIGNQRWITGVPSLSYVIAFNNEPTAIVPAQQVIVAQPLGSNVNLSSLNLLGITIPNSGNDVNVSVPAEAFNPAVGLNEFITNVDLRPTQSLLVNVDALLNPATQTLTWTLTSIDPATGQPPVNPLIGFLPPGAGATLSFSVAPKQGLATGSQVAEQASILFVGASPMTTPTWVNTIDNSPPVSHVSSLSLASTCPSFRVSWSGSDVGSGLQGYTVYTSDNGGPFTPWLSNTTAASATYTGTVGHTYSFYTMASDLVGNLESGKILGEASTTVMAAGPCAPPSLTAQVLNIAQSGMTVTANLQLTNTGFTAAQGINISQISLRTLSGTGTVTLASPTVPVAVGSLAIGAVTTVPLSLTVPSTVTRFSITEGGTITDASGAGYSFSIGQTVIP